MTSTERVIEICKERGIALSKVEKELGYGNGYLARKKKGLPYDRLKEVARYLDVPIDYLVYGDDTPFKLEIMPPDVEGTNNYYFDRVTLDMAQELHDNPEMRLLFSAAKGVKPETLRELHDMLLILKRREMRDDL